MVTNTKYLQFLNSQAVSNYKEWEYRELVQPHEVDTKGTTPERVISSLRAQGRESYLPVLRSRYNIEFGGKILEIGAGHAWLTANLSRLESVKEIYALEFSEHLIANVAPVVFEHFKAKTDRITRVLGDFHDIKFPDATFDFVVGYSVLHHSNNFPLLLKEI